jgi:hypothetical protein
MAEILIIAIPFVKNHLREKYKVSYLHSGNRWNRHQFSADRTKKEALFIQPGKSQASQAFHSVTMSSSNKYATEFLVERAWPVSSLRGVGPAAIHTAFRMAEPLRGSPQVSADGAKRAPAMYQGA